MATPNGYGSNIRQSLVGKGVSSGDIGYNKSNGYVTVKGQDFLKPSKVLDGVSYDTANNFNNAWNNYSKSQAQPKTTTTTGTVSGGSSYVPKNMISTRDGLNSFGINNNSIGYKNGNTTVNGNYFGTPALNLGGTTYYTPQGMNNAMANYRINDLQSQVMQKSNLQDNPYTSQINDQLKALMQMAQNQQQTDPYSTAQYAAYQAQADRRANQGIRSAQEALGSSGFGRSTMLGERAQGIQNAETEYLETQVIPQIIAQEQARQQQQYANMMSLLDPLMNQQGYADNRQQTELSNLYNAYGLISGEQQRGIDNSRADAALTGSYLTPDQQSAISTLLGLKQQAETKGISKEQRAALSAQADVVRNQMQMLGLDPTKYGADINYKNASQYMPGRTLQGQQLDLQRQGQEFDQNFANRQQNFNEGQQGWENNFRDRQQNFNEGQTQWENQFNTRQQEFNEGQQLWKNTFDEKQFEEDTRRFGLNYAIDLQAQNLRKKQFDYEKELNADAKKDMESQYKGQIADMILSQNLPDDQTEELFKKYGINDKILQQLMSGN